ncbi:MAG: hypothetical protein AB7W59_09405, partial [Acidimicrobiia bacterium]
MAIVELAPATTPNDERGAPRRVCVVPVAGARPGRSGSTVGGAAGTAANCPPSADAPGAAADDRFVIAERAALATPATGSPSDPPSPRNVLCKFTLGGFAGLRRGDSTSIRPDTACTPSPGARDMPDGMAVEPAGGVVRGAG